MPEDPRNLQFEVPNMLFTWLYCQVPAVVLLMGFGTEDWQGALAVRRREEKETLRHRSDVRLAPGFGGRTRVWNLTFHGTEHESKRVSNFRKADLRQPGAVPSNFQRIRELDCTQVAVKPTAVADSRQLCLQNAGACNLWSGEAILLSEAIQCLFICLSAGTA